MSGEGSSRAARKRSRGPVPRPQGDPAEQAHTTILGQRHIRYHTREILPVARSGRLRESPLLQFDLNTKESRSLDALIHTDLLPFKRIDWGFLDHVGQRDRVEDLVGDKFRAALCCDAPQFKELTLEFHATFQYNQGNFKQHDAVSFSLGRRVHEMTMAQFAVATQFYTREEVRTPEFVSSLRGVFKKRHEFSLVKEDLARFWGTISNAPFSGSMLASEIIDPVHRFLHKILTATLVGRGSGENKINHVDLFCLLCMIEGRAANVACILAWSMKRTWRGGPGAAIYFGPYVTRIVESLGVFDRYVARYLREGPAPCFMGVRELQAAGILTLSEPVTWEPIRPDPRVQPPPGTPAAEAMQSSIPTRYQRPLTRAELPPRQYPLREPRPDPLTLDSLYDRMETGFGQLHGMVTHQYNDLRQMIQTGQHRQEDALQYMMTGLNLGVPNFFSRASSSRGRVVWRM